MLLPRLNFLIVGAAKSGTTSLHRYLAQHPGLFLPEAKELAAYLEPEGDPVQERLLQDLYTAVEPHHKVGLTHASMLMFRRVPARVCRHHPTVQIIALLRDPVERAYSSYWAARLRGIEPAASFEQAIAWEQEGKLRTDKERIDRAHLEPGFYAAHVTRFRQTLGPEQVFTLLTEDLAEQPETSLRTLLAWLRVDDRVDTIGLHRRYNETLAVRSPTVEGFLSTGARPLRAVLRALLPLRSRLWLRNRVIRNLKRWNRRAFVRPPMKPETRERLNRLYRQDLDRLQELLQRDLSSWLTP